MTRPYVSSEKKRVGKEPPPLEERTPEERIREIRRIINKVENSIEALWGESPTNMEDQLTILRDAVARIEMILGSKIEVRRKGEQGKRRRKKARRKPTLADESESPSSVEGTHQEGVPERSEGDEVREMPNGGG